MNEPADIVFVVHGSNAHTLWRRLANRGYPWWRRWSLFCHALRKAFQRECEIREYVWSGLNSHDARMEAGRKLAAVIQNHCEGRPVHIVGHSHGGNVALAAANWLPAGRIQGIVLLANPHMEVVGNEADLSGRLYWGNAHERVGRIWNLYSPDDVVQLCLARFFHGLPSVARSPLRVRRLVDVVDENLCNVAIRWTPKLAAHRGMHSSAVGTVTGRLLAGDTPAQALAAAGLTPGTAHPVRDRGGFQGIAATQQLIRELHDPSPFDFPGTRQEAGVLLIHGFTASPSEMRPLGEFLHRQGGWRCKGILLPGHGTRVEDMQTSTHRDWLDAVERAKDEVLQSEQRVFLVGMSLGAVLCLHTSLNTSERSRIAGIVLLAPAFGISLRRKVGFWLLRPFRRYRSKGPRSAHYFLDRRLFSYIQTPLNRAAEVLKLGHQARQNLGKLKDVPILMLTGDLDRNVSLKLMHTAVADHPWMRLVRLAKSRHILTVEPDQQEAFDEIFRFMKDCLGERA